MQDEVLFELGRYQVLKSLGKGGMGEVFLAFDPQRNEKIALKRIHKKRLDNPLIKEQFLKEAKLLRQLCHPYIIPIYEIVNENADVYFTMPFIEGKTLKSILADALRDELTGPDFAPTMAQLFLDVCQAVSYAHSVHLIHRDLKPSNIIIRSDGHPFILDWGLVTEYSESAPNKLSFEKEDKVAGTTTYLAPELAMGLAPSVQSEIYSLGLVFYEMLTLRLPFHRNTIEEYAASLEIEVLVDPMLIAPFLGGKPSYSRIVFKCLALRPQERYQSVEELIADLQLALDPKRQESPLIHADSLFKSGQYKEALSEYEQFQKLYFDTLTGHEACFQAALCLLNLHNDEQALRHLEWLEGTPASLLKYLGKIHIFHHLQDREQELATYEEVFRRFLRHPLIKRVQLELLRRMKECQPEAKEYYHLAYLIMCYLPLDWNLPELHLQQISFMMIPEQASWQEPLRRTLFAIQLAVFLKRADLLEEIILDALKNVPTPFPILELVLLGLVELGAYTRAYLQLDQLWQLPLDAQAFAKLHWIAETIGIIQSGCHIAEIPFISELPPSLTGELLYPIFSILNEAKRQKKQELIERIIEQLNNYTIEEELRKTITIYKKFYK